MPLARVTQTGAELAGEPLEKQCAKESLDGYRLWQGEWIQWPGKGKARCLASGEFNSLPFNTISTWFGPIKIIVFMFYFPGAFVLILIHLL